MNDNYIHKMMAEDILNGEYTRPICTRFPPEPNGYLHIGSLYAIHFSYFAAHKFGGKFNLRFDDTNPLKEDMEFVNAIIEDMKWMGWIDEERIFFGSDYSDFFYDCAVKLIKLGKAYVCDLSQDELRDMRGTLIEAGTNSPYRERTIEENLKLLEEMKAGVYPDGSKTLRAKIDMASPNINMRDPVIYRILHESHYRTGDKWCIYPMYDYAHPLQDAYEGVTHSLCSIEFRNHRPLYEWVLETLEIAEPPRQREFGRMNMTGVVTSKRYLKELVYGKYVSGWDDPRMPTIKGLRRRGYTKEAISDFIHSLGVSKDQSTVDISMLDHCLRKDLKERVPSLMCVLNPIKVTITNYPDDKLEWLAIDNNASNEILGMRQVPFGKHLFIEGDDFMLSPIKGFKRLTLGGEVRLKGAYFIKCNDVRVDEAGNPVELLCTYDVETKSGSGFSGRKVKGTIHWVHATENIKAEIHLFDRLFEDDEIARDKSLSWHEKINPNSHIILNNCLVEKALESAESEDKFQFMRHGYFTIDEVTQKEGYKFYKINRIVPLKSSF
ncbi:glutamine--tRNA ligase/YqeY domain fusion protein [Fusibacter ferrireducens]|uniref:Glutamine--tRNA ligase n=1 Tax=Fusibacter ferrireducens TaxID=2785058 RepID=A0ABR9ZV10_9FIRM|nr:glutamine--tRNA ligase/YqeY domain fusion protein [Fusibacter ferrireducens]MBF4693811.1 glutamine--tRNA ligase/YqeY domain fusion protein [Fusibacter ferrireducens]